MGKDTPKQEVTAYFMSLHFGICTGPAELLRVSMGDKTLWQGNISDTSVIGISLKELYGGIKSEGGAVGAIHFYPGKVDQKMSTFLSFKYGRTPETMTGYRGIASFAMTEHVSNESDLDGAALIGSPVADADRPGFYYSANSPYLRTINARVKRIPDNLADWQASIAAIDHIKYGDVSPMAIFFCVGQSYYTSDSDFDGVRNAIAAVIDKLVEYKTRSPDARFDIGCAFSHSLFFPTLTPINFKYHNASLTDLAAAKTFILTTARVGSESLWRRTFELMHTFFQESLPASGEDDPFSRRVAVMIYNANSTEYARIDTDLLYGGLGEDVVTLTGGTFNTTDGTAVDTYTVITPFIANDPDYTGADRFANQPVIDAAANNDEVISQTLDCVRPKSREPDMNAVHIIYECLTEPSWGMGAPPTMLNLAAFEAAAQTIFDEEFGLSLMWAQQTTIEAFIQEIIDHIQATLYVDPTDGLISIKLIRNDYDPDDLITLDKDNANITSFQRKLVSETINEIVVTWTNPENEQEETVSAQDLANISIQGGIVSDSRNYYGVRTKELATFLAWRDLAPASAPLVSCEIETDRSTWNFVPGGVVKLSWPEYGISSMIMRIGQIDYGKPGDMRIKLFCMEDVFGLDLVAYTVPGKTQWTQPSTVPVPAPFTEIFTLNYAFTVAMLDSSVYRLTEYPDAFIGVMASTAAIDNYEFELYTPDDDVGTKSILSRGLLATALDAEAESVITIAPLGRSRGAGPAIGGFAVIGEGDESIQEIAYITDVARGDCSINRGSLDTTPKAWPIGTPIWFISPVSRIADPTVRSDAETATIKVLPRTNAGLLALADAPVETAVVNSRPWRPTRPANVSVAGQTFGSVDITGLDPVTVTWAERNRLTEDTVFLAWDAAGVLAEGGQTTKISLLAMDGTLIDSFSGLSGSTYDIAASSFTASRVRVRVEAERDGYISWQGHEIVCIGETGYGYGYGYDYGGA